MDATMRRTWMLKSALITAFAGLALTAMLALTPAVAGATVTGQLYGSGANEYGQLGNGETNTSFLYQPIPGLSSVVEASPGDGWSVTLLAGGTVEAFGHNESGELGDGTTEQHDAPEAIPGLSGVTNVAAGAYAGYALLADGTVKAWGYNREGQLGDGEANATGCYCEKSPVPVKGLGGVGALSDVVAISAGYYDAVALLSNGTVVDWGYNDYGELGDGETAQSDVPVQVKGIGGVGILSNVVAVSAGGFHNVALLSNGTVVTWGYNDEGELGDGETAPSDVPVQVEAVGGSGALSGVSAISAGYYFNLALLANGTVYGWGYNLYHELGDGETTEAKTPVQVPGLTGVSAISAGAYSGQALANGTLYGWGYGKDGELGNGIDGEIALPRQASSVAPSGVVALADRADSDQSLILQGATASVSSAALAFGGQAVGTRSAPRTVTVTNAGPAPLTISGQTLSGSGEFALSYNGCAGTTLSAGASCSISAVFSPSLTGEVKAALSIASTAANALPTVSLVGTGVTSAQLLPSLKGLRLSATAFKAATRGPSIVNVPAPGSVISYTDSQPGVTTFTVEQASSGVLSGRGGSARCVAAPSHPRRGAKRCVFYRVIGSFSHVDRAGANRFRFTGRVKGRKLAPGSYRLIAVAHSPRGRSAARTARFRILAR